MKYIIFISLALLSFFACHSIKKGATSKTNANTNPMKNSPPKWEVLTQGRNAGIEEQQQLVIKSEAEWKAIWAKTHSKQMPTPECPAVDFGQNWVLACYRGMGNNTCYGMKVTDIQSDGKKMNVNIVHTKPGANCMCGDMVTYSFVFVKIAHFKEKENFLVKEEVKDCK